MDPSRRRGPTVTPRRSRSTDRSVSQTAQALRPLLRRAVSHWPRRDVAILTPGRPSSTRVPETLHARQDVTCRRNATGTPAVSKNRRTMMTESYVLDSRSHSAMGCEGSARLRRVAIASAARDRVLIVPAVKNRRLRYAPTSPELVESTWTARVVLRAGRFGDVVPLDRTGGRRAAASCRA